MTARIFCEMQNIIFSINMISHTDAVTRNTITGLLNNVSEPAVTIVLSTSPIETEKGPIKLANAIQQVEKELTEAGVNTKSITAQLGELKQLIKTPPFWSYQSNTLVIYLAPDFLRLLRLPINAKDAVITGRNFYLRPLFRMTQGNGVYFVLTLSRKSSTLYACTRDTISQLDFEPLPSMPEVLELVEDEAQIQFHTGSQPTIGGNSGGRRRAAMFFGHGGGPEKIDVRTTEYFRALDEAVCDILGLQETPLVLAGDGPLHSLYRNESRYPNVMQSGIDGNFETGDEQKLHAESWPIVRSVFEDDSNSALRRFNEIGDRDLVLDTLLPLIPAAHFGAVDTLILASDAWARASYNPESIELEIGKESAYGLDELYDLAARATFQNGGTVIIVEREELPAGKPAVAILRYPFKEPTLTASSRERDDSDRVGL